MSQFCKGICKKTAVPVIKEKNHSMYIDNKHCSTCSTTGNPIFFKTKEIICPCCRSRLGIKPKRKSEKEVYEIHKSLITSKKEDKK